MIHPSLLISGILLATGTLIPPQISHQYGLELLDSRSLMISDLGIIYESYSADNHTWIFVLHIRSPLQIRYSELMEISSRIYQLGLSRFAQANLSGFHLEIFPPRKSSILGAGGKLNISVTPIKSGSNYYYLIEAIWDPPHNLILMGICSGNSSRDLVLDLVSKIPAPPKSIRFPGYEALLGILAWLILATWKKFS